MKEGTLVRTIMDITCKGRVMIPKGTVTKVNNTPPFVFAMGGLSIAGNGFNITVSQEEVEVVENLSC